MKTLPKIAVRVLLSLVGAVLVCYGSARCYLAYEAYRAGEMFRDLESVTLGGSESDALAISRRYDGHRWISEDKKDFFGADHVYALEVNPWHYGNTIGHIRKLDGTVRFVRDRISSKWGRRLGFRKWLASGGFAISDGRIIGVQGIVVVEGRDQWLEGGWNLVSEIPAERKREGMGSYVVERAHLLWDDEGAALNTYFTPAVSSSDAWNARYLNLGCLAPHPGCSELSDLMPDASKYFKAHEHAPRP